jgi:hypothetical protein
VTHVIMGRPRSLRLFLFPERYDSTGTDLSKIDDAGLRAASHYFAEEAVSRRPQVLQGVFSQLADEWNNDTQFQSSLATITSHPAYQKIVSLGDEVVPLILRDMAASHRPWFSALREITGIDPVHHSERGNVAAMVNSWLRWARASNIRW